jgi:hypothetical protein
MTGERLCQMLDPFGNLFGLRQPPADDGQLNLPRAGHAKLPGGGQRDYFA